MSEHKEQSLLSKIREAGVTLQGGRTPFQRTQGNAIVTWCDEMKEELEAFWEYISKEIHEIEDIAVYKLDRAAIWGGE